MSDLVRTSQVQKDGFPGRDSWEIVARGRPSLGCTSDVRQFRWNTAAVHRVAELIGVLRDFLISLHFCAGNSPRLGLCFPGNEPCRTMFPSMPRILEIAFTGIGWRVYPFHKHSLSLGSCSLSSVDMESLHIQCYAGWRDRCGSERPMHPAPLVLGSVNSSFNGGDCQEQNGHQENTGVSGEACFGKPTWLGETVARTHPVPLTAPLARRGPLLLKTHHCQGIFPCPALTWAGLLIVCLFV